MGKGMQILHRVQTGFTLIEILVVVAILGALTAVVIPNILGMMHQGEVEAMETEKHNVQVAVYSMMITAGVVQLDGTSSYNEIDELDEVHSVTATHSRTGVTYYLDDYLHDGHYPLLQPYEISIDGHVSVDQDTQTTVQQPPSQTPTLNPSPTIKPTVKPTTKPTTIPTVNPTIGGSVIPGQTVGR